MSVSANHAAPPFWRTTGFIIICGCLISLVSFGVRSTYGLFNDPITLAHGWSREAFAFALAVQNLLWGLGQPIAGVIADRFGSARVIAIGGVFYVAGIALSALSTTPLAFTLSAGVLVGLGLSGASMGIVVTAFGKLVSEGRRSWAMGLGTAAGSAGQLVFAPLGQAFISGYGWQSALFLLAVSAALMPVLALALRSGGREPGAIENDLPFVRSMRVAFGHNSYLLLVAGFFVCGFQLGFITIHLPPYLNSLDMDPAIAAWAIGLIGLFNVIGAYTAGILGTNHSKRYLLSALYVARALAIAVFITVPQTPASIFLFAAVMGLMWLSTVPLTSGLVAVMFGTRYLATLFGVVFFSHQLGSFIGVWLGGLMFDLYGDFNVVWWMAVVLGLFAALVHLPIVEKRVERFAGTG